MRALTYVELGAASLVVIIGALALHEHDAHIREEAVSDAVQKVQGDYQKQLQKVNDDVDAKIKARDVQYQEDIKNRDAQYVEAQKSVQQMAAWASKVMNLPTPITVNVPPATKDNPTPQPIITIPKEDQATAGAYLHACDQCQADKAKAQQDAADRLVQMANAQKEIDSLKGENKSLADQVKGGSMWHRTWTAALVSGCAGGGAYVGSSKGSKAAALGAVIGAVVCKIAAH